jgi:excisionase family DNA binding protein
MRAPMEAQPLMTPETRPFTEAAYLTPREVATMLRVSEKTVYRLAKADPTMPKLKLAGAVRFPRERLQRWLRDREQGHPHPRLSSNQERPPAKPATLQAPAAS